METQIELIKNNIIKLNNKIKRSIGYEDYSIDKMLEDRKELESLIKEYSNLLLINPELIEG